MARKFKLLHCNFKLVWSYQSPTCCNFGTKIPTLSVFQNELKGQNNNFWLNVLSCTAKQKVHKIALISKKTIIAISCKLNFKIILNRIHRIIQDLCQYIYNKILSWQLTEIVPFLLDWIGNILYFNPVVCIAIQGLEWPPLKSIIFGWDCQGDDASCTSHLLQGVPTSFELLFSSIFWPFLNHTATLFRSLFDQVWTIFESFMNCWTFFGQF